MGDHKILAVDDEPNVLKSLTRLLRNEAFETVTTTSPAEALALLEDQAFSAVVSDQRMPDMVGTELLEKAAAISPDTVRIILTGFADTEAAIDAINRGAVYRFLTKPWQDEELVATVRQAVSHYQLVTENRRLAALTAQQNEELRDLNQNLEMKVVDRTQKITKLNKRLEKSFLGTIQVMAGLSELHSPVIGSHSKRVAAMCDEIAVAMELSVRDRFQLRVAATLHDIGKVGVENEILQKPLNALTPSERKTLESHVLHGEVILGKVPDLGEAALLVRHHHERGDGSGYPDRLRGERVCVGVRIIAAADAYDNSLNRRDRFQSATPKAALSYVQSLSPAKLDHVVVSVLADCLAKDDQMQREELEAEVALGDLRPGLVLSRDLRTASGVLLLQKNSEIQKEQLVRIQNFQVSDPIVEGIFVFRRRRAQPDVVGA